MTAARQPIGIPELKSLLAAAAHGHGEVAGVVLPERAKWPRRKMTRIAFREVDFHSPLITGGFLGRVRFEECTFDDCAWGGVNALRADFIRCEFRQVRFGHPTMASLTDCVFQDCTWTRCKFLSVQLNRCDVTRGRLDIVPFAHSNFRGGTLSKLVVTGRIKSANFIDADLHDVDFSTVAMADTSFVGSRLHDVALPDTPRCFFVSPDLFLHAEDHLRPLLSARGFGVYTGIAGILGRSTFLELVEETTFSDLAPSECDQVLGVLYRLSHPSR